jgi:hypothetical protein
VYLDTLPLCSASCHAQFYVTFKVTYFVQRRLALLAMFFACILAVPGLCPGLSYIFLRVSRSCYLNVGISNKMAGAASSRFFSAPFKYHN